MPPADITLTPATEADFGPLRELATAIWRQHYPGIISVAQIDYMLACRFSDEALRAQAATAGQWLELLRVAGSLVGYCGCEVVNADDAPERSAMKLGQLYVADSHRGRGLGRFMLDHVERRARSLDRDVLFLQVNKRNAAAIRFYETTGFRIARDAVFDIGSGFVMDDYVMQKRL